jgi:hypothetical protein
MSNHRITHIAAVALAIAAAAAPAAAARPVDGSAEWKLPHGFQTADSRDAVTQRGLYEPMRPEDQPQSPQDLRMPDTVDYADGRGTYNAPEVVVVDAPPPVAAPSTGGIDWEDVGIGAGGLVGIALVGLGGALAIVHRRGRRLAS